MKNYKNFFSLLLTLLFLSPIMGQDQSRNIVPPSPTAASLGKFGDIPVSYYTGTPDITVPLYEVKSGTLSMPISLSYNATGIRVAEDASWVGLGWSLYAGGLVSRVVRGKEDLNTYFIQEKLPRSNANNQWFGTDYYNPNTVDSTTIHDGNYFSNMKQGVIDGEPDMFSYNFGVYSGKFVIDKLANGGKVFTTKKSNLDIIYSLNGNSFTIVTPDGNKYLFATSEMVISAYNNSYINDPSTVVALNGLDKGSLTATSSWYLDRIISPFGDTIEYKYKTGASFSLARKNEKDFTKVAGINIIPYYYEGSISRELIYDVYLSKITFKNGRIDFETDDRLDIEGLPLEQKPQKLSKIKIFNGSTIVKEIVLSHGYFNQNSTSYADKRLKLDSVQVEEASNKYIFSYYDVNNLPNKYSRQVDIWGFYTYPFQNGTGYQSLLPEVSEGSVLLSGAKVQRSDETGEYVKKGILTSMTYPTGGKTEFKYQPHEFANGFPNYQIMSYAAVLDYTNSYPENHIEEPTNSFTLTSTTFVSFTSGTSYHLDASNVGWLKNANGAIEFIFNNESNISTILQLEPGTYTIEVKNIPNHRTEVRASYNVLAGGIYKGNGLRIESITNFDTEDHVAQKKSFIYTTTGAADGCCSSGLLLTKPKNYYFKDIQYIDEEADPRMLRSGSYLVRSSSSSIPEGFYSQPNVIGYSKVCVKEGINKNEGATIYNYYNEETDNSDLYPEMPKLFDTRNGQLLSVEDLSSNGNLVKKTEYSYSLKEKDTVKAAKVYKAPFDNTLTFSYDTDVRYYNNISEWWIQSQRTEINYSPDSFVLTDTVIYRYDNPLHKQVTSTIISRSDKTKNISYIRYPHDFNATQPYVELVNKHIWEPIIERELYKIQGTDTTFLKSERTSYGFWNGVAWDTVITNLVLPHTVETRIIGQTNYLTINRFHTYDNRGNLLTVSKENDVKLTYLWGYNRAYPVAQVIGVDYATISSLIDQDVLDNPSSTQILNSELNKLRAGLVNIKALVTTYTYDPLIGMTSQTDANNRTTYYEYDDFNRLKNIRDADRKIVKNYSYKYGEVIGNTPLFSCSSLETLLTNYRQIDQPGRMNSFYNPSGISRDQSIKDTRLTFRNGLAQLPEQYRTRPADFYSSFNLNLADPYLGITDPSKFCFMADGYSVEWRLRMPANTYNKDILYTSINFGFGAMFRRVNNGILNGTYLYGYTDFDGHTAGAANGGTDFDYIRVDDVNAFDNFQNIKLKVTPTRYYVYYNDHLIKDYPRNSAVPIDTHFYVDAAFIGNDGALDHVKVFDNSGVLKFVEDFNDGENPAKPKISLLCPVPAGCQTAFANYFNQANGTAYNFAQINTMYQQTCGHSADVCQ